MDPTTVPPAPLRLSSDKMAASSGEIPSLDGLRAISIGIVLFGHFMLPVSEAGVAAIGVVVFFFISGFLITRLLFLEHRRSGHVSLARFYTRRSTRLYPVLVLYLAVVGSIQWQRTGTTSLLEIASAIGYFSNYLITWRDLHGIPFLLPIGGLWSLAIEEHFYIVMPLGVILLRVRPRSLLYAALLVCVGCLLVRAAELIVWPEIAGTLVVYRHSETRFDAIAIGVLMAALAEMEGGRALLRRLSTAPWLIGGGAAFCASYLIHDDFARQTLRYSIQQAALLPTFCGILFGRSIALQWALNHPALRWVGRLSYSLYIWQGGAKFLLAGWIGVAPWLGSPVALLVMTFSTAALSYYLVERPLLTLRNRLLHRPMSDLYPTIAPTRRNAADEKYSV
jgi:peptidoglycan/LPS O-acetylase OafA/YrhL